MCFDSKLSSGLSRRSTHAHTFKVRAAYRSGNVRWSQREWKRKSDCAKSSAVKQSTIVRRQNRMQRERERVRNALQQDVQGEQLLAFRSALNSFRAAHSCPSVIRGRLLRSVLRTPCAVCCARCAAYVLIRFHVSGSRLRLRFAFLRICIG